MENVRLEKKNNIAYVTIDRPKVLNSLNMATMEEVGDLKNVRQIFRVNRARLRIIKRACLN